MSTTTRPNQGPGQGWPDCQGGTGVTNAREVWSRLRIEQSALEREIAGLQGDLAQARSRMAALEAQVAMMRASAAQGGGSGNPLYRRVGLDQNAPTWLVAAVRRAYRAKLHPDAHPAFRKAEAERRFKEAEGIFDQIAKLRGSG